MQNNELPEELNEPRNIKKRGLYSPQPLPAQIVLANAKKYAAQRVLLALSSYLGGVDDRSVFPTYLQIKERCGAAPSTISRAIKTLVEMDFIFVLQYWKNGRKHNKYIFKNSCWHFYLMSPHAKQYLPVVGDCFCGQEVKEGDLLFGNTDYHHYGCGDIVIVRPSSKGYKRALAKNRVKAMEAARSSQIINGEGMGKN